MISTINGAPASILDILLALRVCGEQPVTFSSGVGVGVGDNLVIARDDWNDILNAASARMLGRGWASPASVDHSLPARRCVVKGCGNRSDWGVFVGDLCMPCSIMIATGVPSTGNTFIHAMQARLNKIANIATQ